MSIPPAATSKAIRDRPIERHPFVIKLLTHASLSASDLKALNRLLNRRLTVKKGKDIIVQGFEYKELYIVESGFAVRYTLVHKGGRQIINTLLPGDIAGFPESFFDRSLYSVKAATEMSLNRISFDAFIDVCNERPNIAVALISLVAHEASLYAHHLVDAGRRSPLERVAHFLLEIHFRLKAVGMASENTFEIPLSQEDIADRVGLSGPHANRMISQLKREGLIAMRRHEIKILDRAALQIIAEFDPSYLVPPSLQQLRTNR
ncbi:Crp/Fnr family transcriptional regulator [Bradyrhizobium sp.]|uniref:Crp/Fnr family transcriptional regulator n=1 Tax=Bradyrhizobium sp. TaxID=376 RepID=UPI003C4B1EFD